MSEATDEKQNGGGNGEDTIGRGRKLRLVGLVIVLAVLGAVLIAVRLSSGRAEEQRAATVEENVAAMREALAASEFIKAEARWRDIEEAAPGHLEAARLGVPLYYAAGSTRRAIEQFILLRSNQALPQIDPGLRDRIRRVNRSLEKIMQRADLQYEPEPDLLYLQTTASLWGISQRIVRGAESDTDRALKVLRWLALYTLPQDPHRMEVRPMLVLWRRFGSPTQLTWTYIELARQAGLECRAVLVPGGGEEDGQRVLAQVYPADATPFLVDPAAGVPVLDPETGRLLSLADLREDPAAYRGMFELAGAALDPALENPGEARVLIAAHPFALLPRFAAFEQLLAPLASHPHVFALSADAATGASELWDYPVLTALRGTAEDYRKKLAEAHAAQGILGQVPDRLLYGPSPGLDTELAQMEQELRAAAGESGVEEDTAQALTAGLDHTMFYRVANAHELGEHEAVVAGARAYLEAHPDGLHRQTVRVLLADSLEARGQEEAADEIWRDLSPGRRVYGALRVEGLLPMTDLPAPPATRPATRPATGPAARPTSPPTAPPAPPPTGGELPPFPGR